MERFYSTTRKAGRRGLTLIELVVVLTILVAMGGLLVPMIGSALTRTHVATCSATYPELTKMLSQMHLTTFSYGDNWTTGVDTAGDAVNGGLTAGTLEADEVTALAEIGIVNVWDHAAPVDRTADYNITFEPELTSETLSDSTSVLVLDDTQAAAIFLETAGDEKYVWFGIDTVWDGVGTVTPEPPVHFGDADNALPHQAYSRFGAIFQVADADGNAMAEFKRVSYSLDGEGNFETADNHIGIHWQEVVGD